MNLISRYIFGQIMIPFVMCTIVLTAIAWVTQASRLLDLIILRGQAAGVFFRLTLLIIPGLIGIIAPVGLFIAGIYTLNRLNQDSELAVIYAAGSGKGQIVYPFLLASVLVSCFVFLMNAFLMPLSLQKLRVETVQIRTDLVANLLQPGRFISPIKDVTIYFRERDENGDMMGVIVHDGRQKDTNLSIMAKRGKLVTNDQGNFMIFYDGNIQHKNTGVTDIKILVFTQYAYDLAELSPGSKVPYLKPMEKFIGDLYDPDPKDPYFLSSPQKMRSELHRRLVSPFYPLVFIMISLVFLANANTARQGQVVRILQTIILVLLVRATGLAMTNLSGKTEWAVFLVYAIPIAAIVISAYIIAFSPKFSLPEFVRSYIAMRLSSGVEKVK